MFNKTNKIMSLFDKASLVVTPNGVKEGKLYSIKPTYGSGDLDVVRATTATRVNSEGLIEVVPRNLVTYSEQFNNALWSKTSCSITANATTAPNGTLTADLIQATGASAFCINVYNPQNILTHTRSIWAKTTSGTGQVHLLAHNSNSNSLFTITNEWQRFELTGYNGTGGDNFYAVDFRGSSTLTELLIWGGQAEVNTSATSYFPTTDRLNIPRLDYTNGSCPSILVEPQRTNLLTYSEQFDNASWQKVRATITANTLTAPDGTVAGDELIANVTGSNGSWVRQIVSAITGAFSMSIYAKQGTSPFLQVSLDGLGAVIFDLSNGTIKASSVVVGSIVSIGSDGWYRCTISGTATGQTTTLFLVGNSSMNLSTWFSTLGDSVYLYGAQLEAGSYATSYIPTVGSAVTRNADVISKTGISDLIGQTEGTMLIEGKAFLNGGSYRMISISDGTNTNVINIEWHLTSNNIFAAFNVNGVSYFQANNSINQNENNKLLVTWQNGMFKFFTNGIKVFEKNTFPNISAPLFNTLKFSRPDNSRFFEGKVNQILFFKEVLTEAECIILTTL